MDITKTQFNGREEYLAWRSAWRAAYAALTNQIRDIKFARHHSTVRLKTATEGVRARVAQIYSSDTVRRYGGADGACWELRGQARAMLFVRKASKIEAQRQYQERKAQTAVA